MEHGRALGGQRSNFEGGRLAGSSDPAARHFRLVTGGQAIEQTARGL
jgi:hypothetical protein